MTSAFYAWPIILNLLGNLNQGLIRDTIIKGSKNYRILQVSHLSYLANISKSKHIHIHSQLLISYQLLGMKRNKTFQNANQIICYKAKLLDQKIEYINIKHATF